MNTLALIRKEVNDWIEDYDSTSEVNTAINRAIGILSLDHPFTQLNRSVSVTPSLTGVITLPARSIDIVDIYPTPNGDVPVHDFAGARRAQTGIRRTGYFWRAIGVNETNEFDVTCDMVNGSNVITEAASTTHQFSEDMINRELVLIGSDERYRVDSFELESEITRTLTIFPEFRYESGEFSGYITPSFTDRYALYDSNGTAYTGDVTVDYRQSHPILVNDNDRIIIPAKNSIVLEAVRYLLRSAKYDVDAERLEREAMHFRAIECPKNSPKIDLNSAPNDSIFMRKGGRSCRRG